MHYVSLCRKSGELYNLHIVHAVDELLSIVGSYYNEKVFLYYLCDHIIRTQRPGSYEDTFEGINAVCDAYKAVKDKNNGIINKITVTMIIEEVEKQFPL